VTTLLAHEWLAPHGGSENVFEQLGYAFPGSRRLCLWNDAPERFVGVDETFLARTPLRRYKALALSAMPLAWSGIKLDGLERVVVSSHAFAHQLASRAASQSIPAYAYVHSPARYVWNPELDPRGQGWGKRQVARALKPLDRSRTSDQVSYAANSEYVARRISNAWGRQASVVYPPVDVLRIRSGSWRAELTDRDEELLSTLPKDFVFTASRLVSYKRIDLSIEFAADNDCPLVVAGDGPERPALEGLATARGVPVTFVGRVSDPLLFALYERSLMFVFLAIEDFGIMPVEAMASGAPAVVSAAGGARESVDRLEGGGVLEPGAGPGEAKRAFENALGVRHGPALAERAEYFSNEAFRARVVEWAQPA
jgi:glycosyltransferase involved in cell wall biosynthesis